MIKPSFGTWDVCLSRGLHTHDFVRLREKDELSISRDLQFVNASSITWTMRGAIKVMHSWMPKYKNKLSQSSSIRVAILLPAGSYYVKHYERQNTDLELVLERLSDKTWPVEAFDQNDYPMPTKEIREKVKKQFDTDTMRKTYFGMNFAKFTLREDFKRDWFDIDEILGWMGVDKSASFPRQLKPVVEEQSAVSPASEEDETLIEAVEAAPVHSNKHDGPQARDELIVRDLKRAYQLHLCTIKTTTQTHLIRLAITALEKALQDEPEEVPSLLDMD